MNPNQPDKQNQPDCLSNDYRGGVEVVGCRVGLDLVLRHDGGRATSLAALVNLAIDDLPTLQVLLNDFCPCDFDILLSGTSGPLANSVDHVLFHQNTNLFGQIGAGRQFRYPLADDLTFRHVALTFADEVLVRDRKSTRLNS